MALLLDKKEVENNTLYRYYIENKNFDDCNFVINYDKNIDKYSLLNDNYNLNSDIMDSKKLSDILNILIEYKKEKIFEFKLENLLHLNRTKKFTKCIIDYYKLIDTFQNYNHIKRNINIIKELLLTPKQIFNNIVNEIKKVNSNTTYKHFIKPIKNNPYKLHFNFCYDKINIVLLFEIDSLYYPLLPPKIKLVSPSCDGNIIFEINNIKDFKLENWNPTVSISYIIEKLGKELVKVKPYLNTKTNNTFYNKLSNLVALTNITIKPILNLSLDIMKLKYVEKKQKTYWEKGTGYGHRGNVKWDIKAYQEEQKKNKDNIIKDISEIYKIVIEDTKLLNNNILNSFVKQFINGMSIIDFQNNNTYYNIMLDFIMLYVGNKINIFSNLYENILDFKDNINIIKEKDSNITLIYTKLEDICSNINIIKEKITKDIKSEDVKDNTSNYLNMVKKYQYIESKVPSNYYYMNKKDVIKTKSMIRILGELQTLKKSLPINYDTSIILRYDKSNIQYASFFVVGPKDTPYHNGIFEFHMRFPGNYPNSNPLVNLMTTGNGSVRFNPNLYNSGKVCLSLLGTWSGSEGESWNPSISTSLQVLISIQSLIFCEEPYFNEPGYERERGTKEGDKNNKEYNEEKQIATIRWAINDMIKNPISSIKNFTHEHFRMKRDEINKTTIKWLKNCSSKYKNEMMRVIDEMNILLHSL